MPRGGADPQEARRERPLPRPFLKEVRCENPLPSNHPSERAIMGYHGFSWVSTDSSGVLRGSAGRCGRARAASGREDTATARASALKGRPAAALSAESGDGCRPNGKGSRAGAFSAPRRHGKEWELVGTESVAFEGATPERPSAIKGRRQGRVKATTSRPV